MYLMLRFGMTDTGNVYIKTKFRVSCEGVFLFKRALIEFVTPNPKSTIRPKLAWNVSNLKTIK